MLLKISLIVFIYISAQIPLGNSWMFFPCKTTKVDLTEDDKQRIRDEISEFIDWVTLNETATFWKEPKFHDCFNDKSVDYNFAIVDFRSAMATYSDNFWHKTKLGNQYLVEEKYQYIKNITDLIEKARNVTYLETQISGFSEENLKKTIKDIKSEILEYFLRINQNFMTIESTVDSGIDSEVLSKAVDKFAEEVEKVKKKSIEFIKLMKTCMGL